MNRDVAVYDYLKLLNDMNFKGILKISVSVNWQLYKKIQQFDNENCV